MKATSIGLNRTGFTTSDGRLVGLLLREDAERAVASVETS
jgi:hypothetical protein